MSTVLWICVSDQFGRQEFSGLFADLDHEQLLEHVEDDALISLYSVEQDRVAELLDYPSHDSHWLQANAEELCLGDFV